MITFQDVTLRYDGKTLFENVSFRVANTQKVMLSGRSGIGKTSLLYFVLGFVLPLNGSVFYDDQKIDPKTIWHIRQQIAYVNQDASIGKGRISDLLQYYFHLRANSARQPADDKRKDLFDYFELPAAIVEKDVDELSGGERQRIALIIAVLLGRKTFLLDEVTSNVDKKMKKKIVDFFAGLPDTSILVVSHDDAWQKNDALTIFNLEEKKWVR